MNVKNLGTIAPTLTLTNFYASLLTKSNMAAVGHFGKVLFFVTYTYIVNDFGTQNSFLMLFSSLGLNFHAYLHSKSNMAAVGHIGKVIFFVSYSIFTSIPQLLLILACRVHFQCYFYRWGVHFYAYILTNLIWRPLAILEKSSSLILTPFSCVIPLLLLILVCRIHF